MLSLHSRAAWSASAVGAFIGHPLQQQQQQRTLQGGTQSDSQVALKLNAGDQPGCGSKLVQKRQTQITAETGEELRRFCRDRCSTEVDVTLKHRRGAVLRPDGSSCARSPRQVGKRVAALPMPGIASQQQAMPDTAVRLHKVAKVTLCRPFHVPRVTRSTAVDARVTQCSCDIGGSR